MIKHNLYRSQTLRVFFTLAVFMLLFASQGLAQILGACFAGREYRAVWLTTLSGLDWPSRPVNVPSDTLRQQQALCQILDRLQQAGINTVIFQTRIRATVAYPSNIEPWDGAFSGTPGSINQASPQRWQSSGCFFGKASAPSRRANVALQMGKATTQACSSMPRL